MTRKGYVRSTDGEVMVQIKPGQWVNRKIGILLGLVSPSDKVVMVE